MNQCPQCGFVGAPGNRFCGRCGHALSTASAPLPEQATLIGYGPAGGDRVVPVDQDEFRIGRGADCDLVIDHASISRTHARIIGDGGSFTIEDMGSRNGVMVNGRPVRSAVPLQRGDRIRLGEVDFVFTAPLSPESMAAPVSERDAARLLMLLELSKLINSSLVVGDVLDQVMDSVMEITRAQRGFLMISGASGELEFQVARNLEAEVLETCTFMISMSTVDRVFREGRSFISVDIGDDSRVSSQQSILNLGLKTVMCVPLRHREHILGVIYVDSHNVTRGFNDDDLRILESLADHAAIAIRNARLVEENREMFYSTIEALAEAIEKRDPYTGGHTRRVVEVSLDIASEMNLTSAERDILRMAALLHDIGKIGIEDQVLRKESPLTDEEFQQIRRHPEIGCEILQHIRKLQDVLPGILMHHEKVDGSGYPLGCKGELISIQARIVAVADALDAMVTDRPYSRGISFEEALQELEKKADAHFDRQVVAALGRVMQSRPERYGPDYLASTRHPDRPVYPVGGTTLPPYKPS